MNEPADSQMSPVLDINDTEEKLKEIGALFCENYAQAEPFPHIHFKNFLPLEILDQVLDDLMSIPPRPASSFNRDQDRLKVSYNPDVLPKHTKHLFYYFNSQPFVAFLQELTGISGLIPDPHFIGGGIHEIKTGGHLGIHADFNLHVGLKIERRINVLVYLNKDWQPTYGGQLEIWDKEMAKCVGSFEPNFNECVIFNTDSDSFHGNPHPVNHPQGKARFSIALYYYTATWDGQKRGHTTQFKARPNSRDRFDWQVAVGERVNDVLPPILARITKRAVNSLKRRLAR